METDYALQDAQLQILKNLQITAASPIENALLGLPAGEEFAKMASVFTEKILAAG